MWMNKKAEQEGINFPKALKGALGRIFPCRLINIKKRSYCIRVAMDLT